MSSWPSIGRIPEQDDEVAWVREQRAANERYWAQMQAAQQQAAEYYRGQEQAQQAAQVFYTPAARATLERILGARPPEVSTPKAPEEVQEDVTKMKLANRFKVGCDPEFALLDNSGRLFSLRGTPHLSNTTQVGIDHGGRVVELRPSPAKSCYTLLKRLKTLLDADVLKNYQSYRWKAGAIASRNPTLTLGGHVHLDTLKRNQYRDYDRPAIGSMVDALDRFSMNLERLDILPRIEDIERRSSEFGYGALGDWRTSPGSDSEGESEHIEYRTMSSWLFDPKVAFLCLTGAKLTAVDPRVTMDTLPRVGASYTRLKEFFEAFKGKDCDAERVLEKVLDKPLKCDPSGDFKSKWGTLPC